MRAIEAAAIAGIRGQCALDSVANDHAVLDKSCMPNCEIRAIDCDDSASRSGSSPQASGEQDHAMFARFCRLKRASADDASDSRSGSFGHLHFENAQAVLHSSCAFKSAMVLRAAEAIESRSGGWRKGKRDNDHAVLASSWLRAAVIRGIAAAAIDSSSGA